MARNALYTRLVAGQRPVTIGSVNNQVLKVTTPLAAQNLRLAGFELEVQVITVGSTGTGTSQVSALVKYVDVFNEWGTKVAHFDTGLAVVIAAGVSALMSTGGNAQQALTAFVTDTVIAGNATYNALYRVLGDLPGQQLTVQVTFIVVSLAGYTGQPTTITCSINAIALARNANEDVARTEKIVGNYIASQTKFPFGDATTGKQPTLARWVAVVCVNELSANLTGLIAGPESLNSEQISDLEASAAQNVTPTTVSIGAVSYYVAIYKLKTNGPVNLSSGSSQNIWIIGGVEC